MIGRGNFGKRIIPGEVGYTKMERVTTEAIGMGWMCRTYKRVILPDIGAREQLTTPVTAVTGVVLRQKSG